MNNYQLVKNTEWKEVEINGEDKEIPVDWEVKKINQVAKVIAGQSPDMQNINEKDGIDFHQGNTLFSSKFIQSSFKKILKEKAKKIAPVNSILMSVRAPVGETNITQNEIAIGRGLAALVPSIDRDYLINILRLNKDNISGLGNGSTFEGMKISEFSEFQFAFSPQQSSIASILSHQESVIQDIESIISKYESRFQYLSDELLSGRLRVKEVDGQTIFYKNPEDNWKEVEINGEDKEIPSDWEVEKLKDIAKLCTGNTPSTKEKAFWHEKEGVKWISTPDFKKIKDGYIAKNSRFLTFEGVKIARICPKNTLLVSCIATIGEVGLLSEDSAFNQQINAILPNEKVNTIYLKYYFFNKKDNFINYAPESVVKIINKELFGQYEIQFPTYSEQLLITAIISSQEELIQTQKDFLTKEKQKFDWLLDNLLSGKYLIKENI